MLEENKSVGSIENTSGGFEKMIRGGECPLKNDVEFRSGQLEDSKKEIDRSIFLKKHLRMMNDEKNVENHSW